MLPYKKGQMSLEDMPNIVLIVGLVFLVMATVAMIGQKYGQAIPSSNTATAIDEAVTQTQLASGTHALSNASLCNSEDISVSSVLNGTGGTLISSGNYSIDSDTGVITNLTSSYSTVSWIVNSTTSYAGVACDVNADLETEISDNTSIAGIVLTISLVGIVLTVLIGVFLGIQKRRL